MRTDTWRRWTEWPLTALAVAFLVAYAWPVLDPSLGPTATTLATFVTAAAWVGFAVDYAVRVALAPARVAYVLRHPVDLAVVALPLLRPLRLLRLVTLLSVLNRRAEGSLRGRVAIYVGGATVLLCFVAALAILDAERGAPGANITSFGDAVWWSVATVTTVGYGDLYPTTLTGRFVATGLMLAGIALLGVVTAGIASWLLERLSEQADAAQAITRRDLQNLSQQVADLHRALRTHPRSHPDLTGTSTGPPPRGDAGSPAA